MNATLRALIRRAFGDGRKPKACQFRQDYRELEKRLGPFTDTTVITYAAGVVFFNLEFQDAVATVQRAQDARAHGKGRRPTVAAIERAKRRQGLSWQSYDSAMKRLEELASANRRQQSFRDAARQAVGGRS